MTTNTNTENMTTAAQSAALCMISQVSDAGGRTSIHSGYRQSEYQRHLQQVYDAHQEIEQHPESECDDLRKKINAEFAKHELGGRRPVHPSKHSVGRAFDLTKPLPKNMGAVAASCGASQPEPRRDPNHFQVGN